MSQIPEVEETQRTQMMTAIWIVPIIALFIAMWLAWQHFAQLGPKIEIFFESSAGLKVGQSQVKIRDVPVGVVKDIALSDAKRGVIVTVQLKKEVEDYLNKDSKFWIAKPKIDSKGISGLDTLMSGSYIAMYGNKGEGEESYFIGLESPYIDKKAMKGKRYLLSAPDARDLTEGASVYYRKIKVGNLEEIHLVKDGEKVNFTIFIQEEYTRFVNSQTQFWRTNYMTFDYHDNSLRVDIAPVASLVSGGISLSTTTKSTRQDILSKNHIFPLYKNQDEAMQKEIGFGGENNQITFRFLFEESVGKLEVGAPIELSGFQIGSVVNVESDFDSEKGRVRSVVLGLIDSSVFIDYGVRVSKKGDGYKNLKKAVGRGLKAKLAQGNMLTGSLFVDLVMDKKSKKGNIVQSGAFALFPTMKSDMDGMMGSATALLEKVNKLNLEGLLSSLNNLISQNNKPLQNLLKKLSKSADNVNKLTSSSGMQNLPQELETLLLGMQESLGSINGLLQGDTQNSALSAQITTMLRELTKMSKSVQKLTDKLDRKPNALIFGDE